MRDKYWERLPQAKDMAEKLVTVDPKKRYTVDQALAHPWFTEDEEIWDFEIWLYWFCIVIKSEYIFNAGNTLN